ncbi:MAG: LptF/LptG family permease [Alphaproteobacteria bacterium]|nr:LptF/LptG family permease [Alphaproteobacteria bacterium]
MKTAESNSSHIKVFDILSRYIAGNFLKSFFLVFLCFFVIISILETMEVVRRYFANGVDVSFLQIFKLTVLRATVTVYSFFSFLSLLASIVFFTMMHNKLELTVIKVVGVSTQGLLKSLFVATALVSGLYITVLDGLSAMSSNKVKILDTQLKQSAEDAGSSLTITNSGVWMRDVFDKTAYIVSAETFKRHEAELSNVRIFEIAENGELQRSIHATTAHISAGFWKLQNCSIVTTDGAKSECETLELPTKLSFSNINKMIANPNSVSFWSISKYVAMLDKVGLSSMKYKIHWFSRLSSIVQMFAFLVLATAFCVNYNARNTRKYMLRVAFLLVLAFPIHFFNNVMTAFGESGILPFAVAPFVIPLTTLLLGLKMIERT